MKGKIRRNFNSPIHTLGETGTIILETKAFYRNIYDELGLFQLIGANGYVKKPLITLKPQIEAAAPWVVGDLNYNAVIPETNETNHADLKREWGEKLHHFMVILENNSYDIYHNGTKLTQTPIKIESNETINAVEHTLMRWGNAYALFDDYIIQTKADLTHQGGNIENGQIGVNPCITRKIANYNNILDENSLSAVRVYCGENDITDGISVTAGEIDKTQLVYKF